MNLYVVSFGDCWALAEVNTLLSVTLVVNVLELLEELLLKSGVRFIIQTTVKLIACKIRREGNEKLLK